MKCEPPGWQNTFIGGRLALTCADDSIYNVEDVSPVPRGARICIDVYLLILLKGLSSLQAIKDMLEAGLGLWLV